MFDWMFDCDDAEKGYKRYLAWSNVKATTGEPTAHLLWAVDAAAAGQKSLQLLRRRYGRVLLLKIQRHKQSLVQSRCEQHKSLLP